MTKKAITPLISTVLLLAFAVGLGTLVMSWGNSQKFQETVSCDYVEIGITELDNSKQLCLQDNSIKTTLENNGNIDITSIELVVLTKNSVIKTNTEADFKSGEFEYFTFPLNIDDPAKILKIRLIPYTETEACVNKKVEIEKITECK